MLLQTPGMVDLMLRLLPVSLPASSKPPDRNANVKKVKDFLKINKPTISKGICPAQIGSIIQAIDNPVCVEKKKTHAQHKLLAISQSTIASVNPITLSNRFHNLSVEDTNQENSVQIKFDIRPTKNQLKTAYSG